MANGAFSADFSADFDAIPGKDFSADFSADFNAISAGSALGGVFVVSASIISGIAVGQRIVAVGGYVRYKRQRQQRRDAAANGDVIFVLTSLVPGRAAGDGLAVGREFPRSARVICGTVHGSAVIASRLKTCSVSLSGGDANGESNLYDDELLILLEAA